MALRSAIERLETRQLMSVYTVSTVDFENSNGRQPVDGVVVDGNGNLFGSTAGGGTNDDGTVYELAKGSSSVTALASFTGANGMNPQQVVTLDSNGNIFGEANSGGANNDGTLFEIAKGSHSITTLVNFNGADGAGPGGGLTIDSSGDLFGETNAGGSDLSQGSVFEIPHGTTSLITLAAFNGANGADISAGVTLDSNGNLFGTAAGGGANGDGTVYEVVKGSGAITTLVTFNGANGENPNGVTIDSNGNLFGLTASGGANNDGTIFEIAKSTGALTILYSFNATNTGYLSDLLLDSSGDLFGGGGGQVFELVKGSHTLSTIGTFGDGQGFAPSGVVADSQGDLFGTNFGGGDSSVDSYGYGTIFQLTPDKTPPSAAISAPNITAPGGTTNTVKLVYSDNIAVSAASISPANLSITDSIGNPLSITAVSVNPNSDAATLTATYTVAAPGGSWTANDDGTYHITLLSGQVRDTSGNAVATRQATFTVNTGTIGPVATISTTNVNSASAGGATLSVVYNDIQGAINTGTIGAANLDVTSPLGAPLDVTLTGISGSGNSVTATYVAAPAGGSFSVTDDGSYTVTVVAGSVKDALNDGVATATGEFAVNITGNSTPPAASISTSAVTLPTDSETITVVYSSPSTPIDTTTISALNVLVTDPNRNTLSDTLGTVSGPGNTVTATYIVSPPAGGWTAANDGVYTVSIFLGNGAVHDVAGNAVTQAGSSFAVNLSADGSFNGGAEVNVPFAVQQTLPLAGGQILLVGFQGLGTVSQGQIEELDPDGAPDPNFNDGAVVTVGLSNTSLYSAAVDATGNIIVAGTSGGSFLVARYTSGGSLDTTFGTNGFTRVDFATGDAVATTVAIAPDGAIVAAGGAGGKFALALLDRNGNLDPAFNPDGATDAAYPSGGQETIAGTNGALSQIILTGNGKIVGVGYNGGSVSLIRLNADGSRDVSFGSSGVVAAVPNLTSRDSNGNFVPLGIGAGTGSTLLVSADTTSANGGVGIERLLGDGSSDASFGSGGMQAVSFGGGTADQPGTISVDPTTHDFVLIGATTINGADQTVIAAFGSDGTLDSHFGNGGKLMLAAGSSGLGTNSLAPASVSTASLQSIKISPLSVHGIHNVFGGFDAQNRIVAGSRSPVSSVVQRLQPFTVVPTSLGNVTRKPRTFAIGGTTFTISATGGIVALDQIGSEFDLTLTPTHAGGAMAVTIHDKNGQPLTLADVTTANGQAVHLVSFNAPAATLAGTMSINGAVGTLKLSSVTGIMSVGSIANLTTGDVSGSINCLGTLGVAHVGAVTGVIAAGSVIHNLSALNINGGTILAGANLGADGQIGGTGADADTFAPGKILVMTLGAISNSFVGAGVNPIDDIFGNGNDTAEPGVDTLGALTVRSGLGPGVVFEAGQFAKNAKLPRITRTASDPQHFVVV